MRLRKAALLPAVVFLSIAVTDARTPSFFYTADLTVGGGIGRSAGRTGFTGR